jgi:SRSO17 transposase
MAAVVEDGCEQQF